MEDFLFALFQSCHHLRDWLLNDDAVPEKLLDDLFSAHEEMELCRDISNGTKHFQLTHSRLGEEFSLARVFVGPSLARFGDDATLWVLVDGKTFDAFDLAHKCLSIWTNFLQQAGLLSDKSDAA